MITFLEYYLTESRLSTEEEKQFFTMKNMSKSIKNMMNDGNAAMLKVVDTMIDKFCEFCKLDKEKFTKENSKIKKTILNMLKLDPNMDYVPLAVLYYETTDTYILMAAGATGNTFSKIVGTIGMAASPILGKIYNSITNNQQAAIFMPIKPLTEDKKMEVDMSAGAIGQMAMTLLLSDIDCKVVWPLKVGDGKVGNIIIKILDFLCPSLIDALSLCSFGGASIAGRAAKIAKYAAKAGTKVGKIAAKAGSKVAAKGLAKGAKKVGLKATAKSKNLLKKVPKGMRKAVTKQKNKLKKLNKTSRTMKRDIRTIQDQAQTFKDVKEEIKNMSTDEQFEFSTKAIKILAKSYLPKDKLNKIDKVMAKIPDDMKDSIVNYTKSKVKEKRGEEDSQKTTITDVFKSAIPKETRKKIEKIAKAVG